MVRELGLFTPSELAERYSLAPDTIDHYVKLDLLQPINSSDSQFFTLRCCLRIEVIMTGEHFGFSLHEIKRIIDADDFLKPED